MRNGDISFSTVGKIKNITIRQMGTYNYYMSLIVLRTVKITFSAHKLLLWRANSVLYNTERRHL